MHMYLTTTYSAPLPDLNGFYLLCNSCRLSGTPYCNRGGNSKFCSSQLPPSPPPSSKPFENCPTTTNCPSDQEESPTCDCSYPFAGTLSFRLYAFSNIWNWTHFTAVEMNIDKQARQLFPIDSVSVQNPHLDDYSYLDVDIRIFPADKLRFNYSEIILLSNMFSNKSFAAPDGFGPYLFKLNPYVDLTGTSVIYNPPISLSLVVWSRSIDRQLLLM